MVTIHSASVRAAALLAASALVLTACSDNGTSSDPEGGGDGAISRFLKADGRDGECTEETTGGSVTAAVQYEASGLDPSFPGSPASTETLAIYGSLMTWNATTGSYDPSLAESLEPNADHTEWTLVIRDGVEFGDGTPMTADSVVASIERYRGAVVNPAYLYRIGKITDMVATDDRTVTFTLDAPWVEFPWLLASNVGQITNPAVPAEELAAAPPAAAGAGAFVFDSWTRGDTMMLTGKDDWWGGPVCIDELNFINIVTAEGRADAFEKGEIQAIENYSDTDVSGPLIDEGIQGASWIFRVGFAPNFSPDSPASDPELRAALQAALDAEGMTQRLTNGVNIPETTLVPTNTELGEGLEGVDYDADGAKAAIEDLKAGGWDGKLQLITTQVPKDVQNANQAAAYWKAAGVDVSIDSLEISKYIEAVTTGVGYDVAVSTGGENLAECVSCGLDGFVSSSPQAQGFSDPRIDALAPTLDAAADPATVKSTLGEFQALWNEDVPRIVWGQVFFFWGWSDDLKGVVPSVRSTLDFSKAYLEG